MSVIFLSLRRQLALCSAGGLTFAWLGGSSCIDNSARRTLYTDAGTAAIGEVGSAVGEGADEHVNAIVVEPLTAFFQDLFTAWVNLNVPEDPTYDSLLVQ